MTPDPKRTRFLYGLLFTWVPCLPVFGYIVRVWLEMRASKATGLAATAGGMTAKVLTLIPLCAVVALILLPRTFARGHFFRNLVASISILWSALVVFYFSAAVLLLYTHR